MSTSASPATEKPLPTAPAAATPLIVIDDCQADQLVGDQTAHLASGTLQLYSGTAGPSPELVGSSDIQSTHDTNDKPAAEPKTNAITLRIGSAAFSFEPHLTTVFTHAENTRWYFFSLSLPSSSAAPTSNSADSESAKAVGSGSYVRVTLPEGVDVPGSALEKSRDAFEDVLIGRGFLSGDAVLSAADELGRSVAHEASTAASTLKSRTSEHISSTEPVSPSHQTSFSPATHSFVDGAATTGAQAASMTGWAAEKLANVSISVGERVAGLFGLQVPSEDELKERADAASRPKEAPQNEPTSTESPHPAAPSEEQKSIPIDSNSPVTKHDANQETESAFVLMNSTAASSEFGTNRHTPALLDEGSPTTWEKTKDAVTSVSSGVSEATQELGTATSDSAKAVITHDYGSEAAELATTAGGAAKDAGAAAVNAMEATSVLVPIGAGVYGATKKPSEAGETLNSESTDPPSKDNVEAPAETSREDGGNNMNSDKSGVREETKS